MKTFLLIFIFALSLKADYLLKYESVSSTTGVPASYALCVQDYYFIAANLYYQQSSTSITQSLNIRQYSNFSFEPNYFKDENGRCRPILTSNNQVLISSLTGILIGFVILFFSIFLTLKVGSRND